MQEWVRTTFDNYVDGLEDGQSTSDATILRLGKGTTVHGLLAISSEMSPTRFPRHAYTQGGRALTLISRTFIPILTIQPSIPSNQKLNGRYHHTDSLR